ncbi:TlpA family protein disulfide reductase [Runella limosa]|uniref:TlpA family protein disulfide reductase n=1 Tax=Runella limosa TaxID=370978 RepID=UPI0004069FBB|nr:TlpA disulfide reductase family protein [Runella limosa]
MKNVILLLLIVLSNLFIAKGQKSGISFLPEKPRLGQNIHIYYNPKGTPLDTCKNIKALIYYVRSDNKTYAIDMNFDTENNNLMLILKPDNDVVSIVIIPTNESFDILDTNNNLSYYIILHDNKEIPLKGSYADTGIAYCRLINSNKLKNDAMNIAKELFETEFEKYPLTKRSWYMKFYFNTLSSDIKNRKLLEIELEQFAKIEDLNEDEFQTLIENYKQLKNIKNVDYFTNLQQIRFPDDNYAIQNKVMKIQLAFSKALNFEEKKNIYESLVKDYAYLTNELAIRYVKTTQILFLMRLYKDYFERNKWKDWYQLLLDVNIEDSIASISNLVASDFCKTGVYLDIAEKLIINSIDITERDLLKLNNNSFQSFLTKREMIQIKEEKFANYLSTYGCILKKKNKYEEALVLLRKSAVDYGKRQLIYCNEAYIFTLIESGMEQEAQQEMKIIMGIGKASTAVSKLFKETYLDDVEIIQKQEYKFWENSLKKQMVKQVSPNFSLLNRKGEVVDLRQLKGKVIVVDFWATWCGPCIASFDYFYDIMKKHENDSTLAFVFIDTKEKDARYKEKVEQIMEKKGQNFNVLFDDTDEIAQSYGVINLPTKFIIDRNGYIRFKDIGFDINKPDEFVKKVNWVIDFLKEELVQK